MISISQVNGDADIADVRDLLREYTGWAFTLLVAREVPPTFEGMEKELAGLPGVDFNIEVEGDHRVTRVGDQRGEPRRTIGGRGLGKRPGHAQGLK